MLIVSTIIYAQSPPPSLRLEQPSELLNAFPFDGDLPGGGLFRFSSTKDKVVFINFWATWCKPCVEEMGSMQALSERLPQDRFMMLAINLREGRQLVNKFIEEYDLKIPVVLDENGDISATYNVLGLPTSYIVNRNGKIIYRAIGARDWDSTASIDLFRRLTDEPTTRSQ